MKCCRSAPATGGNGRWRTAAARSRNRCSMASRSNESAMTQRYLVPPLAFQVVELLERRMDRLGPPPVPHGDQEDEDDDRREREHDHPHGLLGGHAGDANEGSPRLPDTRAARHTWWRGHE